MEDIRVDKYLWAVRLYKTRSIATDACKNGRVLLNSDKAKASKSIVVGDTLTIFLPPIHRTFKVIALLKNRVGAQLVADYITDITPQSELDKLEDIKNSEVEYFRPKGTGRPTKRDRRLLDNIRD